MSLSILDCHRWFKFVFLKLQVEWLMSHGLAEVANFFEYNSLTGADLLDVTDDELVCAA